MSLSTQLKHLLSGQALAFQQPTQQKATPLSGLMPYNSMPVIASANEKKMVIPAPIEAGTPTYYAYCAVGGVLSCGITHTAVTPLDLVKCRRQVNPELYSSIFNGWSTIMKQEGATGLMVGWLPTAIGYSMQGVCKFGFYEFFKIVYAGIIGEESAYTNRTALYLAASASAEFFADIALCPMEAVKVRMQTDPAFPRGLGAAISQIKASEGIGGFYKGLTPLWLRQIPYTMMKFSAFERTVEAIYKYACSKPKEEYSKGEQLGISFAGGYIAGVFCAVVSHPADTVVSKLNNVEGATIGSIVNDLGMAGLWRGLGARIIMIGTLTGLQWFIYDTFKVAMGIPTTAAKKPASLIAKEEAAARAAAGK
eukprot:TRINITY_DN180_c0_g2_i1.p1 TRINITY_DN180_c0_g2~~TRINITY_DN180_c0_g2_i1.p1  ORF type:complete len:366 (+),score=121.10 TRINITY_DN180_c0_g2_i1:131-1228(+)